MTKNKLKIFLSLILVFCLTAGAMLFLSKYPVVKADALEQDVVIDKNYRLDDYFCSPNSSWQYGFSGEYDNGQNSGYYYSTVVDGAKVSLGTNFGKTLGYGYNDDECTVFSVLGKIIPYTDVDTQKTVASFSSLKFIIKDNNNSQNVITVSLEKNGEKGDSHLKTFVTYNENNILTDSGADYFEQKYASFIGRVWENYARCWNFEFVKENKTIKIYDTFKQKFGTVRYFTDDDVVCVFDLSPYLEGFESFSVDMRFEGISDTTKSANVMLYEISGQALLPSRVAQKNTCGATVYKKNIDVLQNIEYCATDLLSISDLYYDDLKTVIFCDDVQCENNVVKFVDNNTHKITVQIYDDYYSKASGCQKSYSEFSFTVEALAKEFNIEISDLSIELTNSMFYIPLISTENDCSYFVELFRSTDTDFKFPKRIVGRGIYVQTAGEFFLRYSLIYGNENNVLATKTIKVSVFDTESPKINRVNYNDVYYLDDTLSIIAPKVADNQTLNIKATYKIYLNNSDITSKIKNGKLTFDEVGEYKIVYSAIDLAGNTAESVEYKFSVVDNGQSNFFSDNLILIVAVASAIVVGTVLIIIFVRRKSKCKK